MQLQFARTLVACGSLSLGILMTNCLPASSAFLEADDVRIDLPGTAEFRAEDPSEKRGHVMTLAVATTEDINGWVTSMVEGAATVVSYLERRPSTAREGTTRIYGPYEDNDGRDLSWLVRLDGNLAGSQFELWVGSREAQSQDEMHKLLAGDLHIDGDKRSGGFMLDFDVVELYPQMKGSYAADLYTYAGVVDVNFERDVSTEAKTITIDFQDVEVLYDGFLDSDKFNSDDTYVYERRDDGSGVYHLALFGEWDEWAWSGAEQEEMVLDMAWTPEGAGRARGQMLEANGVGDLKYGDLLVHECFDGDGYLTWRWVTEAYLAEDPDYNLGDEATCTLTEADLINP